MPYKERDSFGSGFDPERGGVGNPITPPTLLEELKGWLNALRGQGAPGRVWEARGEALALVLVIVGGSGVPLCRSKTELVICGAALVASVAIIAINTFIHPGVGKNIPDNRDYKDSGYWG